jgi:dihydroorotate dehydrogenase (fumarate)
VTDLSLSEPNEIRLPLLWLAMLSGRVKSSLAAGTGITTSDEVVKYLLAGADVVMTTSSLLRQGAEHIAVLIAGLTDWLEAREFESVAQAKGIMSLLKIKDPVAFERANYLKILQSYRAA